MVKLSLHLGSCLLLLLLAEWFYAVKAPYYSKRTLPIVQSQQKLLYASDIKPVHSRLGLAFLFGQTRVLPKQIKQAYGGLGLRHLFTPSGLHLSSLLIFIKILPHGWRGIFKSLLGILLLFLPGFDSLKRMGLFHAFRARGLSTTYSFLAAFATSLLIPGSFGSWVYSYLFLGVIIYHRRNAPIFCLYGLIAARLLIGALKLESLTLIGLLASPFLTFVFTLIYPLIVISWALVNVSTPWPFDTIIGLFHKLVLFFNQGPSFDASLLLVLGFLAIGIKNFRLRKILIGASLVFHLSTAGPYPRFINIPEKTKLPPIGQKPIKTEYKKTSIKLVFQKKLVCYLKIYTDQRIILCR